jgi:hypothetical protein
MCISVHNVSLDHKFTGTYSKETRTSVYSVPSAFSALAIVTFFFLVNFSVS